MPLSGLSVNNPQEQLTEQAVTPTTTGPNITFGGNAIGGNAGSATSTPLPTNILVYGAIGLALVFIFQRVGDN